MTDFDYGEFLSLTSDIERYLGYLKGNEAAADWLTEQSVYLERHFEEWGYEAANSIGIPYQTTPSEGDLSVDFMMWHWSMVPFEVDSDRFVSGWVDQLVAGARQSWENGNAWASGIGGYLRDLMADLTRPDAGLLEAAFQEFSDTRATLEGVLPVDWTDLDFTSWFGESSDACQDVVTELHSTVRDQYLTYFAHAETLFGGAGAVVTQAQAGLIPSMTSIRDGLREQCEAWAAQGRWPEDYSGINPLIPDIAGIVSDVIDLVPVVGEIKGAVEDVAGIANQILGLFGAEVRITDREDFEAKTAEEVYNEMTKTLQDDYLTPLTDGMERLRSEKSQAIVAAQDAIDPWFMETLDGLADEPWQHEAEDV